MESIKSIRASGHQGIRASGHQGIRASGAAARIDFSKEIIRSSSAH
jgi:hypothetical protein